MIGPPFPDHFPEDLRALVFQALFVFLIASCSQVFSQNFDFQSDRMPLVELKGQF
jgi:hypothetical protein